MCTLETLYLAEDGYVTRCPACNHYQVVAGTTCITISQEDFARLRQLTQDACGQIDKAATRQGKCFAIGTPYQGVDFIFNTQELLQFGQMLEAADDEAKALAMIGLFKTNTP